MTSNGSNDFTRGETVPLKTGPGYGSTSGLSGGAENNSRYTPPGSARTTSRKSYASNRSRSDSVSRKSHVLLKTQTSMMQDARTFAEGSIPHSMAIGTVIGIVCGVAAYLYYAGLFWVLKYVWDTIPQNYVVGVWPEWSYPLYIPLIGFSMAIGVGLTVIYIGEPGDLPYTIKCVHDEAYVEMSHGTCSEKEDAMVACP